MVNSFNIGDAQIAAGKKVKCENNNEEETRTQFINYGEDDQMEIQGYVFSNVKNRFVWTFYFLTFGTLRLFFHWYPQLHLKATHNRCRLKNADKILVIDKYRKYKSYFVKDIKTLDSSILSTNTDDKPQKQNTILEFNLCDGRRKQLYSARIIRCKKLVYIWDDDKNTFIKLAGFDKGIKRDELHAFRGQSREKQVLKRIIYGQNEISVPVKTVSTLILLEVLTPFYMFQIFSLVVWMSEQYYYYAVALIIMSIVGVSTSVLQTRKNQQNLRGTVNFVDTALISRGEDSFDEVPTTELVPGDVIVVPSTGCEMQCDAVLLTGNCIVNESMLTGESVPITKTALPEDLAEYHLKEDVNHTLFCGTKVIQTRSKEDEKVLAVVVRTGYLTAKGELVRSILYPPPADFKFETDSYRFIGILALMALFGIVYTVIIKSSRQIDPLDILIKSLDLITIAVPPALPAAMTVGKIYALNRLKNKRIFCINSRVINVSGSIDCICFDKTGTLTEDELDMWGVVPVEEKQLKEPLKKVKLLPETSPLLWGMATCHSLTIINEELGGDPLDVKMFESTGWHLEDPASTSKEHHIIVKPNRDSPLRMSICKQFQFSSHLQRMSVIAESSHPHTFQVFCKGSPEMITSLSKPSTVPEDLLVRLKDYTSQGYRVIALGRKKLFNVSVEEVKKLRREMVECDLEFIGLVVLENKLKGQTTEVIRVLKNANMKVVMITGDNIQTGVHVAKECGMVEAEQAIIEISTAEPTATSDRSITYQITSSSQPIQVKHSTRESVDIERVQKQRYCFAITGQCWANVVQHFPELVPKIVAKGTVFARMSGLQKQQLVEELKSLGYYVAMCGDGANDCGALKAAHVGISLSEAESSVASPFTSKEQNISCVPKVIKEGRAALVTSFGIFKIMVVYCLGELASVMILYNIDANLTSFQFLFIDIPLVLNFASLFGNTKAYNVLAKMPPKTSLMGFIPICSMLFYLLLAIVFQLFGYWWISSYDWFTPFVYNERDHLNYLSYENYAIFSVSLFQYISMFVVFSKGRPYRKPLYTNVYFTLSLVVTTTFCLYMILAPWEGLRHVMELQLPPIEARLSVVVIALVNFVVFIVFEDFIVEYLLDKILAPKFRKVERSKKQYLTVLKDLNRDHMRASNGETMILSSVEERVKKRGEINNGFVVSQTDVVTNV